MLPSSDLSYTISRALRVQVTDAGALRAAALGASSPIEADALLGLACFSGDATLAQAAGRAMEKGITPLHFKEILADLLNKRYVLPAEDEAAQALPPAKRGFGSVIPHVVMLKDTARVFAYKQAIERHVRGKTVAEIGCGSGILSIIAAKAGAKHVTAIEETPIADVAEAMFAANGVSDRITLLRCNSREAELEPVDVIIHEIVGTDPLEEGILSTISDARRFLKPGGRLLPERLEILTVGIETYDQVRLDKATLLSSAQEFGALYGLDFAPFLEHVGELNPRLISLERTKIYGTFDRRILTEAATLYDFDLYDPAPLPDQRAVTVRATRSGFLGELVVYFRMHLDDTFQLTNAPYAPPTSWGWFVWPLSKARWVEAGEEIPLVAHHERVFGRQRVTLDIA